jgi:serine/threonine protein kinase
MNSRDDPTAATARIEGMSAARLLARALDAPAPPQPMAHWQPPDIDTLNAQLDAYEVLSLIGRGGMGAVYRARQRSLDRLVAIKVLPQEAGADENFATRFQNEARLLARLQHPNIVAVHDSGATADGHLFLVMELVEGGDLAQMIRAGRLSPLQSLDIVARVCDALQYAHQRGIIHRDIKPSNILLSADGVVKVADFGLAKLHEDGDPASAPTLTGTVMGTPEYMAPEQRLGGAVDQRADIYSLGVLIYEMLTGQVPRGAWEPPSKRSDVDERMDGVVNKALQTEPAKRYQAAQEVKTEVEDIRDAKAKPRKILPWLLGGIVATALAAYPLLPEKKIEVRNEIIAAPSARHILPDLDLGKETLFGNWSWRDGKAGGIIEHTISPGGRPKRLRLPLAAPDQTYTLRFEFLLEEGFTDGGIVFPIGAARTGLLLDLQRISGLGLVRGRVWSDNETSTREPITRDHWHTLELTVKPDKDQASVTITLNGNPFIQWQGPQSDLTLYEADPEGWPIPGKPGQFGLATYNGGFAVRNLEFQEIVP